MFASYMYDKNFLLELDSQTERQMFVRIISLSIDDYPREQIEGKVTGGSINVDGASAIRRSCSLTLNVEKDDTIITDKFWAYNNKFKLEIGLLNTIDKKYPDIIWFNQGIYIITNFSFSKSTNNISVSISGKDKMCRLNGEVAGNLPMSTDFGVEEIENDDDTITLKKIPIAKIIAAAVKEYSQERAENIVIKDLEINGYELWAYRGDTPMYILLDASENLLKPKVMNISFLGDTIITHIQEKTHGIEVFNVTFETFAEKGYKYYSFNTLDPDFNKNATKIKYNEQICYLSKVEYGETAGYHAIPLVYGDDLILNAGDTVTSLLDKIKTMLGEYEYFYDLNGKFIFQKKKNYIQEVFTPFSNGTQMPTMIKTPYSYEFLDYTKFTTMSESPNINNIKNEFSIWGTRKSASGADVPIHVRYAINTKPTIYRALPYYDKETKMLKIPAITYTIEQYDWREIIYRMAIDYYRHNEETDFLIKLEERNPWYIGGKTGYEQYYSDLQAFWRQLYNPAPTQDDYNLYGEFYDSTGSDGQGSDKYWNKKIHSDPNSLNFWFDFLEAKGDLQNYSINKIGSRSKVTNENTLKSIYYKEIPEILFVKPTDVLEDVDMAYTEIQIQEENEELFSKSSQGTSAISKLNELFNKHINKAEGINLTTVPIFYLQPNTRIYVKEYGDYNINKLTYSLNYNGTMTINGTKIFEQVY